MTTTSTSFGLLATLNISLIASVVYTLLLLITLQATTVAAMTISTERPSSSSAVPSRVFELPTRIDDDEVLEEYGQFILAAMNQTMSPCEDFYEYACGNWKKTELVPAKSRNDSFLHAMQNSLDEMMNVFLKNTTEEELKLGTAESKAKAFYNSCLHMNKDMSKGYKLLLEMEEFTQKLEKKEGSNDTFDWVNINFMSHYGSYPLLPLKVSYNTDNRKFELILSAPSKILSVPNLVDVKNLTRDFQIEGEENQKQIADELLQMQAFEKNLTVIASKRNESEILSLGEFLVQHKHDVLNWTRYFDIAFNGTQKPEWVILNTIEDSNALVKFLQRTELSVLRNYLKWRTLIKFYYSWKAELGDKTLEGTCREHTESYFNYALIPWFIDNMYDDNRRADILQIAKLVRNTFYDFIDKYQWLDDETKSNAKTKLRAMDVQVGYTDEMRHRVVIDHVYSDINITEDWFKNLQVVEANRARVRMRSANKAIIPPLMTTRDANAYYAPFLNLAFIAAGISQLPFYHIKFPPSLKYGGIGNIIGHEIAHGFDTDSYQYNYDGKKENWWSEASLRNFRERYRCLESQYNKLIFHGIATNGTMTSDDNIADNVGTRISYYAYMNSYGKEDGDKKPIRGLNFTNKQLYFVKFAQSWCSGKDEEYKVRRMKHDVHAYEEFRVVGTLNNMPEFSEAFECKLGSDMNPMKKCVVW